MTVDECIEAYRTLSYKVFVPKETAITENGNTRPRVFDSSVLERAVKATLLKRDLDENLLLIDDSGVGCKVYVMTHSLPWECC
jgi:hypothetical protein